MTGTNSGTSTMTPAMSARVRTVSRWRGAAVGGLLTAALVASGLAVPALAEPAAGPSSATTDVPPAEIPSPTNTPAPTSSASGPRQPTAGEKGDDAASSGAAPLATGSVRPGEASTVASDLLTVTFSGGDVEENLDVTLSAIGADAADSAETQLGREALTVVVDVLAMTADGIPATSFPSLTTTSPSTESVPDNARTTLAGGTGDPADAATPRRVSATPLLLGSGNATDAEPRDWPAPPEPGSIGAEPAVDAEGFDLEPTSATPAVETEVVPGVALEFPVDPAALVGVDPGSVRIATREDVGEAWTVLPSYLDVERGVVVAHLDHLSQFVVIGTKDVADEGPRVVLDPDNDIAHTSGPGGPATEVGYNVALANQVAAKLEQACLADVVVTRTDASVPMLDQSVRAGMATAHDPVVTATLAFDAALGRPWGTIGNGGSKIYSRGWGDDVLLAVSLLGTLPVYSGRPANGVERSDLPYDDFAGVPGALVHLETLYLDHNFDRPVIDGGFGHVVDGVFTSIGKFLETKGYDCTDPDRGGGWPEPPGLDRIKAWMQLGFKNYAAYGGDPVNVATGNLVTLEDLFTMTGPGGSSVQTALVHNSQDERLSRVGQGWSATFAARLQRFTDGSVLVVRGDGSSFHFLPDGAGGYQVDANHGARLVDVGGDRFELRVDDASVWVFDAGHPEGVGDLVEQRDGSGNVTWFTYGPLDGDPLFRSLTGIDLPGGQHVAVTSDAAGLVTRLVAPDGRAWGLAYDDARRLVGLSFPDGGHALVRLRRRRSHRLRDRSVRHPVPGERVRRRGSCRLPGRRRGQRPRVPVWRRSRRSGQHGLHRRRGGRVGLRVGRAFAHHHLHGPARSRDLVRLRSARCRHQRHRAGRGRHAPHPGRGRPARRDPRPRGRAHARDVRRGRSRGPHRGAGSRRLARDDDRA